MLQEGACKDSGIFTCFYADEFLQKRLDLKNLDVEEQRTNFGRNHGVGMKNRISEKILEEVGEEKKVLIQKVIKYE